MTNVNTENTQDHRLALLNSLLQCPHRALDALYPVHQEILNNDGLFYLHAAAWYFETGSVRDHKEMFIVNLVLHPDNDFREVGLALLRQLPPYQLVRVLDFISKNLKKNIPRSFQTEVSRYLKERENSSDWFDATVLTARKHLKRMYALLHLPPGERAQAILFENNPPADSRLADLKSLAKLDDSTEQARLIIEKRIPYRVASTVVNNMTPTVLLALIEVMTSAELINNMGSLRKHGVFDNPEIKKVVEDKLKDAKTSKNVSALKSMEAVKAAGLSDDLNEALQNVANSQVKSKGEITRPTALLVDKSQSMTAALELGKQLAALISTVMKEGVPFYCYAFDNMPYEIKARENTLQGWTEAFKHIRASGMTGNGTPLVKMQRDKILTESIVMITDEGENVPPAFLKAYQEYSAAMGVSPSVHMVRCGQFDSRISDKLERAGIEVSKYDINSAADYYSLPNIVQFLKVPGRLELLMTIMDWELPKRKPAPIKKDVVNVET